MQVNCTTQVLLDSNYRPFHGIVIIFQNTLVQKMDLYISYSHTPLSIDFVVVTCKLDLETVPWETMALQFRSNFIFYATDIYGSSMEKYSELVI